MLTVFGSADYIYFRKPPSSWPKPQVAASVCEQFWFPESCMSVIVLLKMTSKTQISVPETASFSEETPPRESLLSGLWLLNQARKPVLSHQRQSHSVCSSWELSCSCLCFPWLQVLSLQTQPSRGGSWCSGQRLPSSMEAEL